MRYRRLTKRGAHRDAQVPGGYPVLAVGIIVFIKSKIACAVPSGSGPRNLTLCVRRRATGKGKGCVLSSTKINLLFRTIAIFSEKTFSFFNLANKWTKTRGLFFDLPLISLIAPLLFVSFSPCFAHSPSTPLLGAPLAHDTRAGERAPAPCALSKFPLFFLHPSRATYRTTAR